MKKVSLLTDFGFRCRQLRALAGYTIADQALALGVPAWEIARMESSKEKVPVCYIYSFCYWLKLEQDTVSELDRIAKEPRLVTLLPGMDRKRTNILLRTFRSLPKLRSTMIRGLDRYLKAVTK